MSTAGLPGKRTSKRAHLDDALRAAIRPGMTLHLTTQCRAATRAVQRIFRGQSLDLTLAMGRIGGGHAADLVASGLVRRVIGGSYGAATSVHTGPLRQIQRVHAAGTVEFSHWSFFSFIQRLAAAAQDLPFIPTHSLAGSSMARDNAPAYRMIDDPLGSGQKIGVLAPLRPDLSIVHAFAADEEGNTLIVPPIEDAVVGAKASREGVIVTVERIVDRDFIQRHSNLLRIPARYVRAVCEVPYGAHPGGFQSPLFPGIGGYDEDHAFNRAYFAATRDPVALEQWLERWMFGPGSHEGYLQQLGAETLRGLHAVPAAGSPSPVADAAAPLPEDTGPLGRTEGMLLMAMREVMRSVRANGHDVVLVGVGLSEAPGSAARELLRAEGIDIKLAMGNGFYDLEPYTGRSEPDLDSTLMTTEGAEIYGYLLGGRRGRAMALLGAAQVDQFGNLNSTLVGGKLLTGSGGSNDASSVAQTLVVSRLGVQKLVAQVEYVSCSGQRVETLVTERGVFRKPPGGDRFVLCQILPADGQSERAAVEEIAAGCGWPLQVAPELEVCAPPSAVERATLRRLSPARYG